MKSMPCIKYSVSSLLERHSGLLKSAPIGEHLCILVQFTRLCYLFPKDPYAFIQISYLIAIVMVCSPSAAIGESLVDRMVNRINDPGHI